MEEAMDIAIYPNPTTAYLHVENIPNNSLVSLLDINGKVLKQETATEGLVWNTNSLPAGIYLLHLFAPDGKSTVRKAIVTK